MKRTFTKKAFSILAVVFMSMNGCGGYESDYKAQGLVKSNTEDGALMNFSRFQGTMVFELECDGDEVIYYSAKVGEGDLEIYYDCGDGKIDLCAVSQDVMLETCSPALKKGKVYIIVEAENECSAGVLRFQLVPDEG